MLLNNYLGSWLLVLGSWLCALDCYHLAFRSAD